MKIKAMHIMDAVKAIQALDGMEKPLDIDGSVRVALYRNGSRLRAEAEIHEKALSGVNALSRKRQLEAMDLPLGPERDRALLKVQDDNANERAAINEAEVDVAIKKITLKQLKIDKNAIPMTALIALDFMIEDEDEDEATSDEKPADKGRRSAE